MNNDKKGISQFTKARLGFWLIAFACYFQALDSVETIRGGVLLTMAFIGFGLIYDPFYCWLFGGWR